MMTDDLVTATKKIETEFIEALQKVMRIKSVKSEATDSAPFGDGPKEALEMVLNIASQLGFKTNMISNAIGYAQLGENNEDYIAVVGHLDVVRAGTNWDYPPFDLTLDNGVYYGRGVLDNKGPIMANLFALATLKRMNFPFTKTIRIIFGTDEESGSADIPMYLKKENPPLYGYTPDCKYPAVYGERGVLGLELTTTLTDNSLSQIKQFEGNFDPSSVPDTLTVELSGHQPFTLIGKRAPSNAPDMGINVITQFSQKMIQEQLVTGELFNYFKWLTDAFHHKHNGEGLDIDYYDEESGKLSLTPYQLRMSENEVTLNLSIRYPISIKVDDIITQLKQALFSNTCLVVKRSLPSTSFPKNHSMIKKMSDVYEYATGLDGTPVTTTGATYARSMPNIIAFGPSFPGQKGIAHNKNEYMDKKDLMKNLEIYTLILAELGK